MASLSCTPAAEACRNCRASVALYSMAMSELPITKKCLPAITDPPSHSLSRSCVSQRLDELFQVRVGVQRVECLLHGLQLELDFHLAAVEGLPSALTCRASSNVGFLLHSCHVCCVIVHVI